VARTEQTKQEQGVASLREAPARPGRVRRVVTRFYRWVRGLLALLALAQITYAFVPLAELLFYWLDVTRPADSADVIVCLGGADHRLLWAADLFQRGLAPRVVVSNAPGAAQEMRNTLLRHGLPADKVLVDDSSHTTTDHPAHVAAVAGLDPATHRFLIVTDREHSRRAAGCFERAGYKHFTVYAGDFSSGPGGPPPTQRWRWRVVGMPVMAYECAALLKYRLLGRI